MAEEDRLEPVVVDFSEGLGRLVVGQVGPPDPVLQELGSGGDLEGLEVVVRLDQQNVTAGQLPVLPFPQFSCVGQNTYGDSSRARDAVVYSVTNRPWAVMAGPHGDDVERSYVSNFPLLDGHPAPHYLTPPGVLVLVVEEFVQCGLSGVDAGVEVL